jgi:hypothetical protein
MRSLSRVMCALWLVPLAALQHCCWVLYVQVCTQLFKESLVLAAVIIVDSTTRSSALITTARYCQHIIVVINSNGYYK